MTLRGLVRSQLAATSCHIDAATLPHGARVSGLLKQVLKLINTRDAGRCSVVSRSGIQRNQIHMGVDA